VAAAAETAEKTVLRAFVKGEDAEGMPRGNDENGFERGMRRMKGGGGGGAAAGGKNRHLPGISPTKRHGHATERGMDFKLEKQRKWLQV
jgi:hypothetical protein